MKLSCLFLSILLSSSAVLAAPRQSTYAVLEKLAQIPEGYSELDTPVDLSSKILLKFHVKHRNVRELQKKLLQISDPDHGSYGNHLSKDEVNDLVKPSDK